MGLVTLEQFRARLQAALGNFAYDGALIDVWINAGVQEVAGAVHFEALKDRMDLTYAGGVYSVAAPDDLAKPISLGYPAGSTWLMKSSPTRLDSLLRSSGGTPKFWAMDGRNIVIWPTPTVETVLSMLYVKYHPELSDTVNVTLLPPTWDNAIHYFAVAAAMLDLGDDERSLFWLDKAIKYSSSRLTDAEYGTEATSEPLRVTDGGASFLRQRNQ